MHEDDRVIWSGFCKRVNSTGYVLGIGQIESTILMCSSISQPRDPNTLTAKAFNTSAL